MRPSFSFSLTRMRASVARSELSSMTASAGISVPNRREATPATAAAERQAAFACHGCGSADANRFFVAAEPVAQPSNEHRNVCALTAAIGVEFVEYYESRPSAFPITCRSRSLWRVMSSSGIMKLVSRMSGFARRIKSLSSSLSCPV